MNHKINLKKLEKEKQRPKAKAFNLKNFVEIANSKLNPDLTTLDGLKQFLVNWYCFQYGVTEKDDKLLEMTLEELLVLYQMHRIKEDPKYYEEVVNPEAESYEDWLRKEMGEDYASEEENIKQIIDHDKKLTEKIKQEYPSEITTDFSQFQGKDD